MCISEKISWITLAIGSILNIIILLYLSRIPDPKVIIPIILIIGWQYALLMQIPDALAWRYPSAQYPGKLAFVLNVTQPMVLFILVVIALTKLNISLIRLTPAIITLAIYSILTIKDTVNRKEYNIQPPEQCKYLSYSWWSPSKYILYMLSMVLLILCLAPEWNYVILTLSIFIGSIIASKMIVGTKCNPGSLWCWSIASAGMITFVYYLLSR
jgi:hypothetical protein